MFKSNIAVAIFAVVNADELLKILSTVACNVPALIVVVPVYVLLFAKDNVAVPALVKPPVPLITPE